MTFTTTFNIHLTNRTITYVFIEQYATVSLLKCGRLETVIDV
jgi:hypothetical protein